MKKSLMENFSFGAVLNTPGSSIILGNMNSLVKPLY